MFKRVYPFSAIVGQDELKLALILNAINPKIGGLLIRGEKGTAKSTAVRALAALLPEIRIVEECPYSCNPDQPFECCNICQKSLTDFRVTRRRTRVVTLPLNATEDRVAGSIDFNVAMKEGRRAIQPGLLAHAHRGILYVDEVNLLDDHIVDVILAAASSGENLVEREGLSVRHPACFILVGTMNPEEGELRPQLLDRFGLCVGVAAENDLKKRRLVMQRRELFDSNPEDFIHQYRAKNMELSFRIIQARKLLKNVRLTRHLRTFISELCIQGCVAGHRADLVIEQAAGALAAYDQRTEVTMDDIRKVTPLALAHRQRDPVPPQPPSEDSLPGKKPPEDRSDNGREKEKEQETPEKNSMHHDTNPNGPDRPSNIPLPDSEEGASNPARRTDPAEQVFEVGATFKVRKIVSPKDRLVRRGSGRRSRTRISQKQGRYVKSASHIRTGDIALDATLRAAAPHQNRRRNDSELALSLRQEDVREKIREKCIGNFLLFLVDASGSMGARGRMAASKGAIMSLLLDAYQKRDRVAMVSFRRNKAFLNLPPTSSVEMAARLLKEMPVGGRTPLSAGLIKSFEILRSHLIRDPASRPIVIIITDGKANVALGSQTPVKETLTLASKMRLDKRIQYMVVDTEDTGLVSFGLAKQFAAAMGAQYSKIEDLRADQLLNIVRGNSEWTNGTSIPLQPS